MSIEFKNPPIDARRTTAWDEIASELKQRAGEWALVMKQLNYGTPAHNIKVGKLAAFQPAGSFEARSVTVNGGFDIYARYVGAPEVAA